MRNLNMKMEKNKKKKRKFAHRPQHRLFANLIVNSQT